MSSDLQKRLADVLSGGNGEAALLMGKRYLSEDTLYWSMGANYERTDNDHAIERFIEAWQSNVDYELVADGAFEGKADIMVEHDSSLDVVKVVLYGAGTEDCEPRLYAELLHNIANWIEKNGDTISRRESVTPDLLPMNSDNPFKNEMPDWLTNGLEGTITFRREPSRKPEFIHGETYVFPDGDGAAYGPYLAQNHGAEWQLLWVKPDDPTDGKVAMFTKDSVLYHADGERVNWYEFLTMAEWQGELPY